MFPFKQKEIDSNNKERIFSSNISQEELMWHRDNENRIISSINKTDWLIQLEDSLPIPIENEILIPIGTWHRLIKGTCDLHINIKII
jgi:hypothetical protein